MTGDVFVMVKAFEDKKKAETSLILARTKEENLRTELTSLQGKLAALSQQVLQMTDSITQLTSSLDEAVNERKVAQDVVDRTGTPSEEERRKVRAYLLDLASQV
jgi:uncharacterized coiled-coil DUF342 family protein